MNINNYLQVQTTADSKESAEKLARLILGSKLAACVQITAKVKSLYWWKDKIDESEEFMLLIKTSKNKFAELEKFIKKNHNYETPEIIATDITEGSDEYLAWLKENIEE